MAQWVTDAVWSLRLGSLLWCRFDFWPVELLHATCAAKKKKKEKKTNQPNKTKTKTKNTVKVGLEKVRLI